MSMNPEPAPAPASTAGWRRYAVAYKRRGRNEPAKEMTVLAPDPDCAATGAYQALARKALGIHQDVRDSGSTLGASADEDMILETMKDMLEIVSVREETP